MAREIWSAIAHAVFARKDHMVTQAAQFDLTLPQVHLLRLLDGAPARTMASIADALSCDASNVTGIVDRLEARGLIARGTAKHDRRTKTIALTKKGGAMIAELTRSFFEPPESIGRLRLKDLTVLRALLLRALEPAVAAVPFVGPSRQRFPGSSRSA